MGKQTHIELQLPDRESLERLIANRNTPQKHVWRARIVLLSDDGCGTFEIMRRVGKAKPTVWRWQKRFAKEGVAGLTRDQTRLPGKAPLDAAIVGKVVELTQQPPPFEETHWTGRAMADAAGISVSSVQRIWRAYGLRPHLVKSFKLSNDPAFAEKLHDIVGLYMNPLCASSRRKMKMPDRLHGLPTPAKSSKRSTVGNKRWNQSTRHQASRTLPAQKGEGLVRSRGCSRKADRQSGPYRNGLQRIYGQGRASHHPRAVRAEVPGKTPRSAIQRRHKPFAGKRI